MSATLVSSDSTLATPKRVGGDGRTAALVSLISLGLMVLVNSPSLSTYALKGDDGPLLYHSARYFGPSLGEWFTDGFKHYFLSYPEIRETGTHFIRPVQNVLVYLVSWLVPTAGSPWFLAVNYLGHATVVGLVFLVARRIFSLGRSESVLAALLFFGTLAVGTVPQIGTLQSSVAFGGDMLATLFALAALLTVHSHLTGRPGAWKLAGVVVLLTLALFAKETGLAAPVVVGIYVVATRLTGPAAGGRRQWVRRPDPGTLRILTLLVLPLVAFAAVRLHAGLGDAYPLTQLSQRLHGVPAPLLNPLRFLFTATFPVEFETLQHLASGTDLLDGVFLISLIRALAVVLLHLLVWAAVVYLLRQRSERAWLLPRLLMVLPACVLPAATTDVRFGYFSQALMIPLVIAVLTGSKSRVRPSRSGSSTAWPALVAVLLIVGPGYSLMRMAIDQRQYVALNHDARSLREAVESELADLQLRRVYLINSHMVFPLAYLELYATEKGRRDVAMRVVNTLSGATVSQAKDAGVSFAMEDDMVRAHVVIGPDQTSFGGMTPARIDQLVTSKAVRYGPITEYSVGPLGNRYLTQRRFDFSIPDAQRRDFVVIGFDPGTPGVHIYRPGISTWRLTGRAH
jgi:hypothetical protein